MTIENWPEMPDGSFYFNADHDGFIKRNGQWHELPRNSTATTGSWFSSSTTIPTRPLPPMFGRWIAEQRAMQEEFFGKKFDDFTQADQEDWARTNVLAAEDELHEALGEISWKPWASAEFFNREAYLGEIVDALHFIGNMVTAAGFTDEDISEAYLEKMERNRARQRSGYTGTDKCSRCGRAADDVVAHGGYMKDWTVEQTDGTGLSGYGCNKCFGAYGDDYK